MDELRQVISFTAENKMNNLRKAECDIQFPQTLRINQ